MSRWPARSPLFVGRDGERITRGTLQSRIKRTFKRAGPDAQPVSGALVHGLRHTYATELAGSDVSVYTLMKLLGHESMTTSQRYVVAAGTETRSAAARNVNPWETPENRVWGLEKRLLAVVDESCRPVLVAVLEVRPVAVLSVHRA